MSTMSFREKRALFSLLGVCIICVVYVFGLSHGIPQSVVVTDVGLVFAWILAAVIMSVVALFIPPVAAIVANAGPANRQ